MRHQHMLRPFHLHPRDSVIHRPHRCDQFGWTRLCVQGAQELQEVGSVGQLVTSLDFGMPALSNQAGSTSAL